MRIVFSLFTHINSESLGEKLHDLCIVAERDRIYTFHLENDNRSFSVSLSLSLSHFLLSWTTEFQFQIRATSDVVAKLFLNE